ncbi:MAG: hypothetical protein WCH85_09815 [Methanomicrobiales archaeon]
MSKTIEKSEPSESSGWSPGTKVLVGIIAVVAVVSILAVITLTVAVIDSQTGTSFPYSTSYRVSLPDGQPVTIGTTKILALTMPDGVDVSVDGTKEKLAVGQERIINPRYARISALGVPLMDTDFQITLKYLGPSGTNALFDMTVRTSKQVPEMVISKLIPPSMGAQTI